MRRTTILLLAAILLFSCVAKPATEGESCNKHGLCANGLGCNNEGVCVPLERLACTEGELRSCGTDEGECSSGVHRCSGGQWPAIDAPCEDDSDSGVSYVGPEEEICDGLDNDCDGHSDNIAGSADPLESEIEGEAKGICKDARNLCIEKTWTPSYTLDNAYETDEVENCDGLDNDCDGERDEMIGHSPSHCGGCNVACAEGEQCEDGLCVADRATCPYYLPGVDTIHFLCKIPAGDYSIGCEASEDFCLEKSRPMHTVTLSKTVYIQQHETTNDAYKVYVENASSSWPTCADCPACTSESPYKDGEPVEGLKNHPVVCITRSEASTYCQSLGMRLPTEAEWEAAAGGAVSHVYPWGDTWQTQKANCDEGVCGDGVAETTDALLGDSSSPFGLLHSSGNVWEWCADGWSDDYAWCADGCTDPLVDASDNVDGVIRGGGWDSGQASLTVYAREKVPETWNRRNTGFRCVFEPGKTEN